MHLYERSELNYTTNDVNCFPFHFKKELNVKLPIKWRWVMLSWKMLREYRKRKVSYANAKMVGQAKYGDMPPRRRAREDIS